MYDPLAGRFLTADPVMQAPFWSQGLNRYSYVFNNPVNNTDPSGFVADGLGYFASSPVGNASVSTANPGLGALVGVAGIAVTALAGGYSTFDGSAASVRSGAAPSAAPKGSGLSLQHASGATGQLDNVGPARRPPRQCDVGMCLAQATPGGQGAAGYEIRNDGTGGGAPVEQRSPVLDWIVSHVAPEVTAVINIIISLEEHRQAYVAQMAAANMVPAPKDLEGFPGTRRATPKTSVQGGGGLRKRWVDDNGGIYEWDSQHGAVERYDKRGKHLGEFDAKTGKQTKPADPKRRVKP